MSRIYKIPSENERELITVSKEEFEEWKREQENSGYRVFTFTSMKQIFDSKSELGEELFQDVLEKMEDETLTDSVNAMVVVRQLNSQHRRTQEMMITAYWTRWGH